MASDRSIRRKIKWWWLGTVATFGVGMIMAVIGVQRDQAVIEDLVRSPVGCVSTIDITSAGRFYVYVETKGQVGDLGPCNNDSFDYEFSAAPDVDVRLQSVDGETVDLRPDDSIEYANIDFEGQSVLTFFVDQPGSYVVTVESSESQAVVAIGRNASTMDGVWLVGGATLVMVALALLLVTLMIMRSNRRVLRSAMTAEDVFVTYETNTHTDGSTKTSTSSTGNSTGDLWAPPRPEDRAEH